VVVLPQPEGPTSTQSSPSGTSSVRSLTAMVPSGKRLVTASKEITAVLPLVGTDPPRVPAKAGMNRFVWNLRYPDARGVPGDATTERSLTGPLAPPGPATLVFEKVHFRYPGASPEAPEVLRGVDLRIEPGETMALVGSTGSGKTTLVGLVPRLYEPTGGRITLDGQDIAGLPRSQLRAMVAVAFEDPALFSAPVMENVLMGAEAAKEADGDRALQVAQADDFVRQLPSGVHTQVGEQGLTLSGGERQRLALARAVVGRPRLLVMDDPLSALDIHTEAAVEFCRLAGKVEAGVICEIVNDGDIVPGQALHSGPDMLRGEDCIAFGRKWGIKVCTIAALVDYVEKTEGKLHVNGTSS
jgi:ABC-type multidrug transport system fused ATPase/permease subunit